MKKTLISLILLTVFSLNTFARDFQYTTLEGHTYYVNNFVFSPDGSTLASWDSDKKIRLWDVTTGKQKTTLEGNWDDVLSVVFAPDGLTLVSRISNDDTLTLWDVATRKRKATLQGHTNMVYSVAFSPDGRTLASGSWDRTVRLWDANTGAHKTTLEGHTDGVLSIAFSPDGQTLASGSREDTIRLWDVAMGQLKVIPEVHTPFVWSVAFSPDGLTLASGGTTTRLWDANTGAHKTTLEGHLRAVNSMVFSPDGLTLASGSDDNTIRLWNVATGKSKATLRHSYDVSRVVFSPDGLTLASESGGIIRLWDLSPLPHVHIIPYSVECPAIGKQFSINVSIAEGKNVGGYQCTVAFDATALRYIESANGDYLSPGAFFVPPVVSGNKVTLGATSLAGVSSGDGTLATVTFEVVDVKASQLILSNVILTNSDGKHLLNVTSDGRVAPSLSLSSAIVSFTPSSVLSPAIGGRLVFNVDIAGGQSVADFQLTFDYDRSALEYISSSRGNYLAGGVGNGDGTLSTVTFEVLKVKASSVGISGYLVAPNGLRSIPTFESASVIVPLFGDVNRDGVVNILDLVLVASSFGQSVREDGNPAADVNEDGIVNIVDLVKVAGAIVGGAAAPSAWHLDTEIAPTRADVQQWLSQAQRLNLTDATSQRGMLFLENLLASLTPKETALLPNYPNPFNPETWIPYQLAEPADVTLTIYALDGTVVRILTLGHQPVGIYQDKSRAAYWDGRNTLGEPVASGVYFYTLTSGKFTATRKMLIRK